MLYMLRRSQWKKYVQYQKKLCGSNIIFHIIYKITSIDGIPAATHYCSYLKKQQKKDGYHQSTAKFSFSFQITKVVLLKTFLKLRIRPLLYNQFTSLFTISQDWWPHVTLITTCSFPVEERISVKKWKYMLFPPLLSLTYSLLFCLCRNIFHLHHRLGCDQKSELIVGREYNYA